MTKPVALGLKAHSGWAVLVALADVGGELAVVERKRIELIEPADAAWSKQPYHAAEGLAPDEARDVVRRGIGAARRVATRTLRDTAAELAARDLRVVGCAVLLGAAMPPWSVDEILAVHFRMHKAEGELFRDALVRAAGACGLRLVGIPEKGLVERAEKALREPAPRLNARVAAFRRSVGSPWGKDQKDAALAAWVALRA